MLNEKELFQMMKEMYPQHPSKDFIASTENKLRQKAKNPIERMLTLSKQLGLIK